MDAVKPDQFGGEQTAMPQAAETVIAIPEEGSTKAATVLPWLAGGALLALGAANIFLFDRVHKLEAQVTQVQVNSQTDLQAIRDSSDAVRAHLEQNLANLSTHVDEGSKNATAAAQRALQSVQGVQHNAELMVNHLAEEQKASDAQITKAIVEVKSVADAHTAQVSGLESSVGSVKDELGKTKSTLDQTISDLHSVRGDLGVQSGLIATNGKELAALRELGDRTYYEFTIRRGAGPAKMGNMSVELKKADTKRNKYNINIMADDKTVEKKDRTINEPVQMYVGGSHQPYEIVVNTVQKDAITGYLAVPKVLQSRR